MKFWLLLLPRQKSLAHQLATASGAKPPLTWRILRSKTVPLTKTLASARKLVAQRKKRRETAFRGFCASKTVPLTKPWRQPVTDHAALNTLSRLELGRIQGLPCDLSETSIPSA